MKDKSIIWKAFWMKVPSLLVETMIYFIVSFAGILLNVVFLYGILPNFTSNLTVFEMLKTNEFLYGCFSTITCISLSIIYFYLTSNKTRKFLATVLILIVILTVMFSTVSLSQSNPMIVDFFSVNFMFTSLLFILLILIISVFVYKFDTEQAVNEFQSRQTAKQYTQLETEEVKVNGKIIKA